MKKVLFAASMITGLSLASVAASVAQSNEYATITSVNPVYIDRYVTEFKKECYDVEVPIYGRIKGEGASGADVLTGMIIGGLLGGTVTGKDQGAAAGAVVGGVIAAENKNNNKKVITGYRYEERCEDVKKSVNRPVISYYIVKYNFNGNIYSDDSAFKYKVGERVRVKVSLD